MDPKKKSGNKCKNFAGYLLFSFLLENREIYRIQIDFMSVRGEDVPERVECVVRSFRKAGE